MNRVRERGRDKVVVNGGHGMGKRERVYLLGF